MNTPQDIRERAHKELEELLIDWEGKSNPLMGALRVGARSKKLNKIIDELITEVAQEVKQGCGEALKSQEVWVDDDNAGISGMVVPTVDAHRAIQEVEV